MKSREELRNDYEEALFAMIMDEIMDLEGEALIAERERLVTVDECRVADDVNERCITVINETFESKKKEVQKIRSHKVLRTLLVAAIVVSVLFTTVCASVPAVRKATDKLIIAVYSVSTKLLYGNINDIQNSHQYVFWYIPEGYKLVQEGREHNLDWYEYTNENENATIMVRINYNCGNREIDVDSENASGVENIEIGRFKGILVLKENIVRVSIVDTYNTNLIQIAAKNVDSQRILQMIESVHFTNR